MTVLLPPDISTLRRLVREELTRDDRIEVDVWLGRCLDPRLPSLLQNLIVEHREEVANAALQGSARVHAALFDRVLRAGRALIDYIVEPQPELAPALLAPALPAQDRIELVQVGARQFELRVHVAAAAARLIVLAVNDRDEVHTLEDRPGSPAAAILALASRYEVESSEGRVTFWCVADDEAAAVDPVPHTVSDLVVWLEQASSRPLCRIAAARITPSLFEDA